MERATSFARYVPDAIPRHGRSALTSLKHCPFRRRVRPRSCLCPLPAPAGGLGFPPARATAFPLRVRWALRRRSRPVRGVCPHPVLSLPHEQHTLRHKRSTFDSKGWGAFLRRKSADFDVKIFAGPTCDEELFIASNRGFVRHARASRSALLLCRRAKRAGLAVGC